MLTKIISLIMSVIMFFTSFLPSLVKYADIGNKTYDLISDISAYVEKNLPVFDEMFDIMGEAFYATSVEKIIPCTVLNEDGQNDEAAYIDFNGNFGYIIISKDYFIYAYKCEGNLGEINSLNSVIYSVTDGFVYEENGEYIPYSFDENKPDSSFTYEYFQELFNYSSSDGSIDNTDEYIKEEYGDGYVVTAEGHLEDFDYLRQFDTSVYIQYSDDKATIYSEGNCALNALTCFLSYLSKMAGKTTDTKFSAIPVITDTAKIYATEDKFFDRYKADAYDSRINPNGNYKISGYNARTGICSGFDVPVMYKNIRNFCIDNYGYETGGLAPREFLTIIPYFFDKYGIKDEKVHEYLDVCSFSLAVRPQIDKGYPVLWSVYKSSTYGDHTTSVTGYKVYKKTQVVNGISVLSDVVVLLELNDNWAGKPTYFDYTKFTFGEGYFYTLNK